MNANASPALEDLVRWRGELDELVRTARSADPSAHAVVDRSAVEVVLAKAVGSLVEYPELTTWAQAVHVHDGVDIEDGHEDLLAQFLFEASTPELFEPITPEFCQRWLDRIRISLAKSPAAGR
ncbi:hypothetical protein GCM10018781_60440 [Kitasatospora indigofera]|uniref:Uncharacterized protein n=1 Tax=Kitasatospora indigofera TaxID=67307 RepID=A0A919L1D7_9ACTN|nr:hypothetical protein [Kitasatospora indigofera]GHH80367.1 hypothetical protein GCM10018781_60440 [Kitasatospora indigofera]